MEFIEMMTEAEVMTIDDVSPAHKKQKIETSAPLTPRVITIRHGDVAEDGQDQPVPDEVVPDKVVPDEVVPGEVVPYEVVPYEVSAEVFPCDLVDAPSGFDEVLISLSWKFPCTIRRLVDALKCADVDVFDKTCRSLNRYLTAHPKAGEHVHFPAMLFALMEYAMTMTTLSIEDKAWNITSMVQRFSCSSALLTDDNLFAYFDMVCTDDALLTTVVQVIVEMAHASFTMMGMSFIRYTAERNCPRLHDLVWCKLAKVPLEIWAAPVVAPHTVQMLWTLENDRHHVDEHVVAIIPYLCMCAGAACTSEQASSAMMHSMLYANIARMHLLHQLCGTPFPSNVSMHAESVQQWCGYIAAFDDPSCLTILLSDPRIIDKSKMSLYTSFYYTVLNAVIVAGATKCLTRMVQEMIDVQELSIRWIYKAFVDVPVTQQVEQSITVVATLYWKVINTLHAKTAVDNKYLYYNFTECFSVLLQQFRGNVVMVGQLVWIMQCVLKYHWRTLTPAQCRRMPYYILLNFSADLEKIDPQYLFIAHSWVTNCVIPMTMVDWVRKVSIRHGWPLQVYTKVEYKTMVFV